jgi:hypothetical protein
LQDLGQEVRMIIYDLIAVLLITLTIVGMVVPVVASPKPRRRY